MRRSSILLAALSLSFPLIGCANFHWGGCYQVPSDDGSPYYSRWVTIGEDAIELDCTISKKDARECYMEADMNDCLLKRGYKMPGRTEYKE